MNVLEDYVYRDPSGREGRIRAREKLCGEAALTDAVCAALGPQALVLAVQQPQMTYMIAGGFKLPPTTIEAADQRRQGAVQQLTSLKHIPLDGLTGEVSATHEAREHMGRFIWLLGWECPPLPVLRPIARVLREQRMLPQVVLEKPARAAGLCWEIRFFDVTVGD